jgi:hypothetical protein
MFRHSARGVGGLTPTSSGRHPAKVLQCQTAASIHFRRKRGQENHPTKSDSPIQHRKTKENPHVRQKKNFRTALPSQNQKSLVAQRKRAGLITRRSLDRNEAKLDSFFFCFCSIFFSSSPYCAALKDVSKFKTARVMVYFGDPNPYPLLFLLSFQHQRILSFTPTTFRAQYIAPRPN